MGTGASSKRASTRPPASAMIASTSKRSTGPFRVISRTGAYSLFPTSRFAWRRLRLSAAPVCGTPRCAKPSRPRSCKLAGDGHAAGRHADTRGLQARHLQFGIEAGEIREARRKTEKRHRVERCTVTLNDLRNPDARKTCHLMEIFTIITHTDFVFALFPNRRGLLRKFRQTAFELGRVQDQWVEFNQQRVIAGHQF